MSSFLSSLKEVFNFETNQVPSLIFTIVLAFVVGLFVYLIYRLTFSGVIYSKTFNMSLVMLTMITAMVILFMSNNLKLSLGCGVGISAWVDIPISCASSSSSGITMHRQPQSHGG